ncbi:MAG: VCBS repeat-containing protein [Chitinophagaceae bacterium]|nr:VCBS repeat-containing protein [Chitinophagaceae bacterium]
MRFINDSTGYALGDLFSVLKTTDSGKIWEPLPRENNFSYLGYSHNDLYFINNDQFWAGGSSFIELTTNGGGTPLPKAYFNIDTAGVSETKEVRLVNFSKPNYQYKWYRNDTLISTSYNATYSHNPDRELDTLKLIVSNGAYTDTATKTQYFLVPSPIPVPVITTVSPASGTAGTTITITGLNFDDATAVSIGGIPVASFSVVSSTSITAIVPEGGNGAISVTTSYGTTTKNVFTLTEPKQPVIISFSPASAPAGSVLTISGKNFSTIPAGNIVNVGGVRATVLTATPTRLTVTVPTGAVYKPISVTVSGLTGLSNIPFVVALAQSETITSNTFPVRVDSDADGGAFHIASADLDGDGKPDMVTGNFSGLNRIEIYRNTSRIDSVSFGPKTFVTLAQGYSNDRQVALGDIDGDGKPDLLVSNDYFGTGFYVFRNLSTPGQISFGPKLSIPGTETTRITVRDLNNDGLLDVIGVGYNKAAIYQNTSSGNTISFEEIKRINIGSDFDLGRVEAVDFDGDGKNDIVATNRSQYVMVYRNTSIGSLIYFSNPVAIKFYTDDANIFAIGDLDLDGRPDLTVSVPNENNNSDSLFILRNTSSPGSISFSQLRGLSVPYSVRKIMINDLNGDGKPEIVSISHAYAPQINIRENHSTPGSIVFGPPVVVEASKNIYYNGDLLDLNGDGKTDIVELNAHLSVFLNQSGPSVVLICSGSMTSLNSDLAGNTYQWQINTGSGFKNIVNDDTTNNVTTASLTIRNIPLSWNNYLFRCIVDGNNSKEIKILVESSAPPSTDIFISDTALCANSLATFTATAINGGDSPIWQWQVNGQNAGINISQFSTASLNNNDYVNVILTSNSFCRRNEKDTSNTITVTVSPVLTPQVSITADKSSICEGSDVTFTAIPVNAESNPVYTWYQNDKSVITGINNTYTTNSLTSTDFISVQMTTSQKCALPLKVNSNELSIEVKPSNPLSVTITASPVTAVCSGSDIYFDAQAMNAGSTATYQWQVNGNDVSMSYPRYVTDSLKNGDRIQLILTDNTTCSNITSVSSNTIVMQEIRDKVNSSITISGNTTVNPGQTINLQSLIVNGGPLPSYLWEDSTAQHGWAAVNSGTDATLTYLPPVNAGKIRCRLISNANCVNTAIVFSSPLEYIVNIPTAIAPIPANNYNLRVSPNPVHNFLIIDTFKISDNWQTIEIIDVNGKQVLLQNIQNQSRVRVQTDGLSQGMFIAVLRRKNGAGAYLRFLKM